MFATPQTLSPKPNLWQSCCVEDLALRATIFACSSMCGDPGGYEWCIDLGLGLFIVLEFRWVGPEGHVLLNILQLCSTEKRTLDYRDTMNWRQLQKFAPTTPKLSLELYD